MSEGVNIQVSVAGGIPYASLEELKGEHSVLLGRRRGGLQDGQEAFLDQIETFLRRGYATGVVLGDEADRFAAQSLLTYWSNVLYRDGREVHDESLPEFDLSQAPALTADCPYLGMDRLVEGRPTGSTGWRRLIGECLKAIERDRLLAVVGAFGSGPATLVRGGVIPALREGSLPGSEEWLYPPPLLAGTDPLTELVRRLRPDAAVDLIWLQQQAAALRAGGASVNGLLGSAAGPPVVLVVEQFEQLFQQTDRAQVQAFVEALLALARWPDSRHAVIVVTRPDCLSRVATLGEFGKAFRHGQVLMTFANAELRQMIEDPARRIGLRFDEGVVDRLLMDVQGDPAALALLQFTLLLLWEHRQGNRITHEVYDRFAGGRLAIANHAEFVFTGLEGAQQRAARRLMLKLVNVEAGAGVVCQYVPQEQLYTKDVPRKETDKALEQLLAARLVVQLDGIGPGEVAFGLIHEAVATVWPRFVEWVDELRSLRRWRLRLRSAAGQWRDQSKSIGALWGGDPLREAMREEARLIAAGKELDEIEKEFLEASRREEGRQRFWRRARWVAAGAGVLAIFLLIALGVYMRAQERAERERHLVQLKDLMWADFSLQGLSKDDVSEAVVWFSHALDLLEKNGKVLPKEQLEALKWNLRMRLGIYWRRLPALTRRLHHDAGLLAAADFSAQGRWAATASGGQIVRLWDLRDGKFRDLEQAAKVTAVAFSPDEKYLLTGSGNSEPNTGFVQVWDVDAGKPLGDKPFAADGRVDLVAFSPGDSSRPRLLAVVNRVLKNTGEAILWDFEAGKGLTGKAKILRPESGIVSSAAFSPDGDRVATAVRDKNGSRGHIAVWDAVKGERLATEQHPDKGPLFFVCFGPDIKKDAGPDIKKDTGPDIKKNYWIITCGGHQDAEAGEAILWELKEDKFYTVFEMRHKGGVAHAAFSGDGQRIITSGHDRFARVWDVVRRSPLGKPMEHGGNVYRAAFTPDGRYAVTGSRDLKARVWNVTTGELALPPLNHDGTVSNVAFGADGRTLFTTGKTAALVWELLTDPSASRVLKTREPVRHAALYPQRKLIVTVTGKKDRLDRTEVSVWNSETGAHAVPPLSHPPDVDFAALSPDGGRLAAWGEGNEVWLWNLGDTSTSQILKHDGRVKYACFSPDNTRLVTGTGNRDQRGGAVRCWDTNTGKEIPTFLKHSASVTFAAFSPDGDRVVTVTGEKNEQLGEALVWDPRTGKEIARLLGHKKDEPIVHAAFSSNGRRIVTASTDDTARVWEAETGRPVKDSSNNEVEFVHTADVNQAFFSHDEKGQFVVTASMDGTAAVWDVKTGLRKKVFKHGTRVKQASFSSPDSRYVVTADSDHGAHVWDVSVVTSEEFDFQPTSLLCSLKHTGGILYAASATGDETQVHTLSFPDSNQQEPDPYRAGVPARPGGPAGRGQTGSALNRLQVQRWNLTPDARSAEDVLVHARLVTDQEVDKKSRNLVLIGARDIAQDWEKHIQPYQRSMDNLNERRGVNLHKHEASKAEDAGQLAAAVWHLSKLIEADAHNPGLLARRAENHLQLRNWKKAIKDFDEAIAKKDFGDAIAKGTAAEAGLHVGRARAYISQSSTPSADDLTEALLAYKEALLSYKEAVRLNKNDRQVRAEKGQVHEKLAERLNAAMKPAERLQELENAVEEYKAAIRLDQEVKVAIPDLLARHAQLYYRLAAERPERWKDVAEALSAALAVSRSDKLNSDLLEKRAYAFEQLKKKDKALEDYEQAALAFTRSFDAKGAVSTFTFALKLVDDRDGARRVRLLEGKGRALLNLSQWELSEASFRDAIALNAEEWALHEGQARAFAGLGSLKEAAAAYAKAIRLAPTQVSLRERQAEIYSRIPDWLAAAEAYSGAIAIRPQDNSLLEKRARAYASAEQWEKAVDDYGEILSSPSLYISYRERLTADRAQLYENWGKWGKAEEGYQQLLGPARSSLAFLLRHARACAEQEKWQQAEADLVRYLEFSPGNLTVLSDLARLRLLAGDQNGYRKICADLAGRFGETESPLTLNLVAWLLVLSEKSGQPPDTVLKFAKRAHDAVRRSADASQKLHLALNTLAVAHYRAGEYAEALRRLEASAQHFQGYQKSLNPPGTEDGRIGDWLGLAMTYKRLNQPDVAKKWLLKAAEWSEGPGKPKEGTQHKWTAWQRIDQQLLLREARELIEPQNPKR